MMLDVYVQNHKVGVLDQTGITSTQPARSPLNQPSLRRLDTRIADQPCPLFLLGIDVLTCGIR